MGVGHEASKPAYCAQPIRAHCCYIIGTAAKQLVPDLVKTSFVIFDILTFRCPDVKNYKWRLNLLWYRMLYSCTHMATVGANGLKCVI